MCVQCLLGDVQGLRRPGYPAPDNGCLVATALPHAAPRNWQRRSIRRLQTI